MGSGEWGLQVGRFHPGRAWRLSASRWIQLSVLVSFGLYTACTSSADDATTGFRDVEENAWSVGSSVGGEEVCAFNEDDVDTVDKIRLR